MPTELPTDLPIVQFTDPATVRLISQAYITEPALSPLADDDEALDFLAALEIRTSARQNAVIPLPADILPEELLTEAHGPGWSYVNAAFCHTRPTGNRFNGPERGAWYAAYGPTAVQTAQAEVCYHLTRELSYTGIYDNITAYRELLAGFTGEFSSLQNFPQARCLNADTDIAYPAGQELAGSLRKQGHPGLLYPSVRNLGGTCLAAFRPGLVQNIRQGNGWQFQWAGTPEPNITKYPL